MKTFWFGVAGIIIGLAVSRAHVAIVTRRKKPEKKSWWTVTNILLVSYPNGCALQSLMEKFPGAAEIVLEGARLGRSDRKIIRQVNAAGAKFSFADSGLGVRAIANARELYPQK